MLLISVTVMTLHLPSSTEGTNSSALVLKIILLLLGHVIGSNIGLMVSRRRTQVRRTNWNVTV